MKQEHLQIIEELANLVEMRDSYQSRVDARYNFPLEFEKKVVMFEEGGEYDAKDLAVAFYNYTRLAASVKVQMIEKRIDYLKTKLTKGL
jgi:hypothetical protein